MLNQPPLKNPNQVTPLSYEARVSTSIMFAPRDNCGARPCDHLTFEGQEIVRAPKASCSTNNVICLNEGSPLKDGNVKLVVTLSRVMWNTEASVALIVIDAAPGKVLSL